MSLNWKDDITEISWNVNVTNIEMSPKLKCQNNWSVTEDETEMLQQLKCHQNWNVNNVTKAAMSPKRKCH